MSDRTHPPCPSWCTTDHAEQDRAQVEQVDRIYARHGVMPEPARWHGHTVAEVPNPENPRQPVRVGLFRDDDPTNLENRTVVSVDNASAMDPAAAVAVAVAIRQAVDLVEGHWSPLDRPDAQR